MLLSSKILDIVDKLQKLDCTLLGNGDSDWVDELLFKPGCHRYQLMNWILSKFEYTQKLSGPQNPDEEKIQKDLEIIIDDLGFNRKISHELVKGTAPKDKQLEFWSSLLEILYLKYDITTNLSLSENEDGSSLSEKSKYIYEEYEHASNCIENVIKNVNLQNLFKGDLQLLPPYVEKEMDNLSLSKIQEYKIPSLQEMKGEVKGMLSLDFNNLYNNAMADELLVFENKEDKTEKVLVRLESSMLETSHLVQDCAKGKFCDVYNELKTLTCVEPEDFVDVGPHFQKVDINLETLLELKKSFPKFTNTNSKCLQISSQLEDLSNFQGLVDCRSKSSNIARLLKED